MARAGRATRQEAKSARHPWKTAFYIRLSREDGNDESYSVKNQRQRLADCFEKLLEQEEMDFIGCYIDDGCTGTDSDREDFQRLLADIDAGKVNCVIVKDLSRLSRNDWECKRYLQHLFVVRDVRFISLELPSLDSYKRPDEIYDLGVSIQSLYNENHCRETSIKVRGTFNIKREKGEFIGAFAPYGYQKDPADRHRLLVDAEAASVVRDIFRWFVLDGLSKNGIVRKLIALGIPCPAAYKRQNGMRYRNPHIGKNPLWSTRSVHAILTNQVYLGHMVQGKQRMKSYKIHTRVATPKDEWFIREGTHEPIIDRDTFEKAQELMRRDTRAAPGSGRLYTFSGFLRCPDCGKAICRRAAKNIVYFACQTYTSRGLCSRHSIRQDKLERMVLAAIQTQVALADDIAALADEISRAPASRNASHRVETGLNRRRQALDKLAALKAGLYVDWKNGDITREEYHSLKINFEEEEKKLQQELLNLESELRATAQGSAAGNPSFEAFVKYRNIPCLDRGIVTELIKVIYIHEGGDITIEFKFADQHKRMLACMRDSTEPKEGQKEERVDPVFL